MLTTNADNDYYQLWIEVEDMDFESIKAQFDELVNSAKNPSTKTELTQVWGKFTGGAQDINKARMALAMGNLMRCTCATCCKWVQAAMKALEG